MRFESLQGLINYRFGRLDLLIQSLTHSSFYNEMLSRGDVQGFYRALGFRPNGDNERMEFLGDAVIGLVVGQFLMENFPSACEGRLSRWRSSLVSRKTLGQLAADLGLGDYILLGRGEAKSGGATKLSILGATLEALVGALYLDSGLSTARAFLYRVFRPLLCTLGEPEEAVELSDCKTDLQERTQSRLKCTPSYRLVDTWGLEHEKSFRIEILIQGEVVTSGEGRSKKDAEQNAAGRALEILDF